MSSGISVRFILLSQKSRELDEFVSHTNGEYKKKSYSGYDYFLNSVLNMIILSSNWKMLYLPYRSDLAIVATVKSSSAARSFLLCTFWLAPKT